MFILFVWVKSLSWQSIIWLCYNKPDRFAWLALPKDVMRYLEPNPISNTSAPLGQHQPKGNSICSP